MEIKNKRGQVAIWIIIAIVFVALIALIFVIRQKGTNVSVSEDYNPKAYIDRCVRDIVNKEVDVLLPRGGFENPKNSVSYYNVSVTYLCKETGYFRPCINQHPLYLEEIKKELYDTTYSDIDSCFDELIEVLEKRGQKITSGGTIVGFSLAPQRIIVSINKEMQIQSRGGSESISNFDVIVQSPLYNLADIASEIASQEAAYCYFEYAGYSILYPKFEVRKTTLSDSTRIYRVRDVASQKELTMAIRGCAIPAGI